MRSILRTDTEKEHRTDIVVDENRQQFIAVLGMRGEGKSYDLDTIAEEAFLKGYTILDLHGADNLENAYYIFPSEDPECKNPIQIPVTLLAQNTLMFEQEQVDNWNYPPFTEQEFYKKYPKKIFNCVNPPRNTTKKPLVEIEIIPPVTSSKADIESEANQKAIDKITQIILNCRDNRRVCVLNRVMFASEKQYYWTLELIVRNVAGIVEKHFKRLEPKDVGLPEFTGRIVKGKPEKTPRTAMTRRQRNYNRVMIVTRELGELCPSRSLKGDKTGESLTVKKAFFQFIKKARHPQIDWVADWQRNNDVEDAIRSQADKTVLKRYNEDLGGDDKRPFFDKLRSIRDAIIEEHGLIAGRYLCKAFYPDITKLDSKYHYLWIHGMIHLQKVRPLRHLHKEPWHRFWDKTGIYFDHDWSKMKEAKDGGKGKTSEQNVCYLYTLVRDFKDPLKNKKPLKNNDILNKLAELQGQGKVTFHLNFGEMDNKALSTYFGRWKKVYEKTQAKES